MFKFPFSFRALLIEALDHEKDSSKPGLSPSEISKVSELLMWVGANDPYATIYITCKNIPYISLFAFLFSSVHIPRFTYDKSLGKRIHTLKLLFYILNIWIILFFNITMFFLSQFIYF